jgi:hypothetical protein
MQLHVLTPPPLQIELLIGERFNFTWIFQSKAISLSLSLSLSLLFHAVVCFGSPKILQSD